MIRRSTCCQLVRLLTDENARETMPDRLQNTDDPWKRFVGWWRGLTTFEKFGSSIAVTIFIASGMTWPLAPTLFFRVFGWLEFWSVAAGLFGGAILVFKVLGQLTGSDDLRWKNVVWWEVLLMIAIANNIDLFVVISSAI